MAVHKPSHLVPRLRFPEFRDLGDWVSRKLQDFLVLNYGMSLPTINRVQGEFPVYGSNGIVGTHNEAFVSEQGIVIGRKGSAGDVHLAPSPFCPIDTTFYLTANDAPEVDFQFLYFLLKRAGLKGVKDLGSVPGLSRKMAYMTEVTLPLSRREQKKIAECLSSLDDLIAAEERKLYALRQHKQGLIQQLFPQPGETVPRLRFSEFHSAPEWQEKELGEISEILMCKRIFASQTNPNDGVPFYKIGTLGAKPDAFISRSLFTEYKSKYSFPRPGEILITCSGTIGKCLVYDGNDAYFQDSNIVWIDNSTLAVSNEFLLHVLSSIKWESLNSTTITRIYGSDLRSLSIKFPQIELEQDRIVDCLSSLDGMIVAEGQKLEALRQHKQGLMQQLFPSPEEK